MSLKSKKIISFLGIFIFLGLVIFLFFNFTKIDIDNLNSSTVKLEDQLPELSKSNQNNSTPTYVDQISKLQEEVDKLTAVPKNQKSISELKIMGWIPDWDLADGFETLKTYDFYSISPFWLLPQENGSLKEVLNKANPELISYVKENNIQLIPTVPLFDADLFSKIFNNEESYKRLISESIDKVERYGYDGLDLDFEEIKVEDKEMFFKLLEDLRNGLHARNKLLVFTALPKWGDQVLYLGHRQTRAVQDYARINEMVDEFRLMTYDFYGRDASEAGPIAPIEWMERVIQYTIFSGIPREKIVLGVHTYAYDWSDRSIASQINLSSDNTGLGSLLNLESGDAYYYSGVQKVINNYNLQYSFNSEWGETIGRYEFEGKSRIVVFPTDESIQLRKELAAEYGIKGISYWRLGDEGSLKL